MPTLVHLAATDSVSTAIEAEDERLAEGIRLANNKIERDRARFGLHLLRKAVRLLKSGESDESGDHSVSELRLFHLRPNKFFEYWQIRLGILFGRDIDDASVHCFYESFGYRFVIELDLKTRKGFLTHLCRVETSEANDPSACLAQSKCSISSDDDKTVDSTCHPR